MCIRLTTHNTSCRTQVLVHQPHYDIYQPFEPPHPCEHTDDYEDGDCEQHGHCCLATTQVLCDVGVAMRTMKCLGEMPAHLTLPPGTVNVELTEETVLAVDGAVELASEEQTKVQDALRTLVAMGEILRSKLEAYKKVDLTLLSQESLFIALEKNRPLRKAWAAALILSERERRKLAIGGAETKEAPECSWMDIFMVAGTGFPKRLRAPEWQKVLPTGTLPQNDYHPGDYILGKTKPKDKLNLLDQEADSNTSEGDVKQAEERMTEWTFCEEPLMMEALSPRIKQLRIEPDIASTKGVTASIALNNVVEEGIAMACPKTITITTPALDSKVQAASEQSPVGKLSSPGKVAIPLNEPGDESSKSSSDSEQPSSPDTPKPWDGVLPLRITHIDPELQHLSDGSLLGDMPLHQEPEDDGYQTPVHHPKPKRLSRVNIQKVEDESEKYRQASRNGEVKGDEEILDAIQSLFGDTQSSDYDSSPTDTECSVPPLFAPKDSDSDDDRGRRSGAPSPEPGPQPKQKATLNPNLATQSVAEVKQQKSEKIRLLQRVPKRAPKRKRGDSVPLSPLPREWKLRKLSRELHAMGSPVVKKDHELWNLSKLPL